MKLSNVLVTGGASGTGYAIAKRFASEGIGVALTSRDLSRAESAAEKLHEETGARCIGCGLDQCNEASVLALYDRLGAEKMLPDSVILCAANLGLAMNPLTVAADEFADVVQTNLVGAFMLIREAVKRHMRDCGGTAVIIGSNTSRRAIRNRSAYIASKGGLCSLAKALALDFGGYEVRVNVLLPGSIHSERWDALDPDIVSMKRSRIPIGREAYPDEVAGSAYYLASDLSAGVNGTELVIDGGVDAQLFPNT